MAVYFIAEITIKNAELYSRYVEEVPGIITQYGGRYLARGDSVTPLAGNWAPERMIVVEFDTLEQVKQCLGSPEYRALAPLREQSTESKAIVVQGC